MTTLLIDTHVLLWWTGGTGRLGPSAIWLIEAEGQDLALSAASVWEIATKVRLGKLPPVGDLGAILSRAGINVIPIDFQDAKAAGEMPGDHRDPFDRMIAAQAILRDLELLSADTALDVFPVRRIWPDA